MSYFERLDLAILDGLFQKWADWWRDRTGKSNFWIARMLWWAFITGAGFVTVFHYQLEHQAVLLFGVMSIGLFLVLYNFDRDERLYERIRTSSYLNWRRPFMPWGLMRLVLTTKLSILLLVSISRWLSYGHSDPVKLWIAHIAVVMFVAILYFAACTPKPPSPLRAGNRLAAQAMPTR